MSFLSFIDEIVLLVGRNITVSFLSEQQIALEIANELAFQSHAMSLLGLLFH